jgi:FlaA1/EpsC-like NDP-sugar epimerase
LERLNLEVLTVPTVKELLSGNASVTELKQVAIEDLLGRDPVAPVPSLIAGDIASKIVVVTGAGGSIGSELCRQVVRQRANTLVMVEITEFALYSIEQELQALCAEKGFATHLVPVLASVVDERRLESLFKSYDVDTVYHAAAYKHVPLVEGNASRAIVNNTLATYRTAKAALTAGVSSFVLISTDKAVRPTNVMGASKRMAELAVQALASSMAKKNQHVSIVRFGNVLGSSGSVVPLFRRQIAAGGPVTITHPDIIRYFMTIPEAAQLVIQAGAMAKHGDVFVLDMGEPVKIVDLAQRMIRLSGLAVKDVNNPNGDVELKFTGLRPGEKLYEELLVSGEEFETEHQRIRRIVEPSVPEAVLSELFTQLEIAVAAGDLVAIKSLMEALPLHWRPSSEKLQDNALLPVG